MVIYDISETRSSFIVANILKGRTFVRVFCHGIIGIVYTQQQLFHMEII